MLNQFIMANKEAKIVTLIEKVRENPCLWDLSSDLYKNMKIKPELWEQVSKESGFDGNFHL